MATLLVSVYFVYDIFYFGIQHYITGDGRAFLRYLIDPIVSNRVHVHMYNCTFNQQVTIARVVHLYTGHLRIVQRDSWFLAKSAEGRRPVYSHFRYTRTQ